MLIFLVVVIAIVLLIVGMKKDNEGETKQTDRRAQMDANLNPNDPYDVCYAMAVLTLALWRHLPSESGLRFWIHIYAQNSRLLEKNKTYFSISWSEGEKNIRFSAVEDYVRIGVSEQIARFLITVPGLTYSTEGLGGFNLKYDRALDGNQLEERIDQMRKQAYHSGLGRLWKHSPPGQPELVMVDWDLDP
jgi:hypothetical protein